MLTQRNLGRQGTTVGSLRRDDLDVSRMRIHADQQLLPMRVIGMCAARQPEFSVLLKITALTTTLPQRKAEHP